MKLLVTKLNPAATLPKYAKPGDAALDLYTVADVVIPPHYVDRRTYLIGTGVAVAIPEGCFGSIRERSGLALNGLQVGGGVVDSGYRGEVMVVVRNLAQQPMEIKKGERIAQLIVQPYVAVEVEEVQDAKALGVTARGEGGIGSTGK